MRVADFSGECHVTNEIELESAISRRHGRGVNAFWLAHGDEKNPALAILVTGDLACLHYFPSDRHPGFRSVGAIEGLKRGELTTFSVSSVSDEAGILNDAIVPYSVASTVAKEFFRSKELPRSIEWFEL